MKVKNIMFAGFAAAIFAGVAGAANAATYELASKQYVNAEDGKVLTEAQTYADTKDAAVKTYVDTENLKDEKLTNKAATGTNLEGKNLDEMYPTVAKAAAMDQDVLDEANAYTDEKIEDFGDTIGAGYQKLDERAEEGEDLTGKNLDEMYPTVAKVQAMDAAQTATITSAYEAADATTLNSAKAYTDEEIAKLDVAEVKDDAGFISSVSETDGKVTAVATAFETVIDDTTKDSAIAPQTKAVKTYVDAEIQKVNNGAAWLEENTASKQYIVQTDTDGNEVLVEIAIIGENGDPVYTPVTSTVNTDESATVQN